MRAVCADKEIRDPAVVEFIRRCLVETGGLRQVNSNLAALGYKDFHVEAYAILERADVSKQIDLRPLSGHEVRKICGNVVSTLIDCMDLEALMSLSENEANRLIQQI